MKTALLSRFFKSVLVALVLSGSLVATLTSASAQDTHRMPIPPPDDGDIIIR